MEIGAWQTADLPEMLAIWNDVVAAGQAFPQENPEHDGSFFAAQSYCGVARDESGQVHGLYILHPNNIGRCGHICNASYAVRRDSRGMGIGRRLVEDSLITAKRLGFRIMQFNAVAADNESANRLYRDLGFTQLGAIPQGFRRPDGSYVPINLYYRPL
ncbi:MAG: GNAT family N-acetyltransferase [Desulfovibrio sp.]|nr:GNAT family N-acetyltransferase [Desulfovibrio sp.]